MRALTLPLLLVGITTPGAMAATVVSIGDGDTLRVNDNGQRLTIRLACIDAPETAQGSLGAEARQTLQALLPIGTTVELRTQTIDRYRRTVAEVYRGGQSINLAMVSRGQAYAYRQYLGSCDQSAYLGAEANAEQNRLGVWAIPGGSERPWDWRQQRRQGAGSLPDDRLLCESPGAVAAGPQLPRSQRRWGRL